MKRNDQFWTEEDKTAITTAKSFSALAQTALSVLLRMPRPIGQVCGPISTGGLGTIEKNLLVFDTTIDQLIAQGLTIFDQMPFEEHFFRIVDNNWGTRANNELLDQFYKPVFESGNVSMLYFIHGWESSEGARWEHELGSSLGMKLVHLEPVQVT